METASVCTGVAAFSAEVFPVDEQPENAVTATAAASAAILLKNVLINISSFPTNLHYMLKELVKSGVDYAADLGMYVIVDWHVLNDRNPLEYKDEAVVFFEDMTI